MKIDQKSLLFSKIEKRELRKFFEMNIDYINQNNFLDYESVKEFSDKYEAFLVEHDLINDDILMLFLAELRYSQLCRKIIESPFSTGPIHLNSATKPTSFNKVIYKWMNEFKIQWEAASSDEHMHTVIASRSNKASYNQVKSKNQNNKITNN